MRGFQRPAIRPKTSDSQAAFCALSRHRRTKVARAAHTSLLKADQWGRGDVMAPEVASSLEAALHAFRSKTTGAPKK